MLGLLDACAPSLSEHARHVFWICCVVACLAMAWLAYHIGRRRPPY